MNNLNLKNIGVDIVSNCRFAEKISDTNFVSRILSEKEKEVFISFGSNVRKVEYLAGRFAAKEAIIKAANTALKTADSSFNYRDISVLNDETGAPYVEFAFKVDFSILISISHTSENTVAFAMSLI